MRTAQECRCLLISPSDVAEERDAISDVVRNWNAQVGHALGARIELVRWETHSIPDLSAPPQAVLNKQLLPECDFAIAVFWSRLGTPTAEYASGSDEEIRRLLEVGTRILVYFSRSPIPQESLNTDQYSRLRGLRDELELQGLVGYYDGVAHLREQVQLHITSVVADLLTATTTGRTLVPKIEVLTATPPDVRVSSSRGIVVYRGCESEPMLTLKVENHSPVPVFIAALQVEMDDGSSLFPKMDSATGEMNGRRRLEPGDSFDFHMSPADLAPAVPDPSAMRRAIVRDAIGRTYRSDEDTFRRDVADVFRGFAKHSRPDA